MKPESWSSLSESNEELTDLELLLQASASMAVNRWQRRLAIGRNDGLVDAGFSHARRWKPPCE